MTNAVRWVALVAVVIGLATAAWADEEEAPHVLRIGDVAPDIDVAHWIKGVEMDPRGNFTPVTTFEPGRVYVLEFWATWCGPCRAGMPHLSELQEKYAEQGVQIIGISDESLPQVTAFLFKKDAQDGKINNDRTHYTLTTDPDASVKKDYFQAAGQTGIPCAFLIGKDGRVEWIGHPMRLEEPLQAVLGDRWDREAFAIEFAKQQEYKLVMRELRAGLAAARQQQDWAAYVAQLDGALEKLPDNGDLLWQKVHILITKANRPADGYQLAPRLLALFRENAGMLNQMAWAVADDEDVVERDLAFALAAAERANELTESKDPAILDTLARVHHEKGDLQAAIRWQEQAAEFAGDDAMGQGIRETLATYQAEAASAEATPEPTPVDPTDDDDR